MAEVLGVVTEDVGRRKAGMRTILSVDLSKAYDKVRRDMLFHILQNKAQTEVEKFAVYLLEQMYKD